LGKSKGRTALRKSSLLTSFRLLLLGLWIFIPASVTGQNQKLESLGVFFDCSFRCDEDFIRREIPFVNYVRDRKDGQVHLLVTRERNGNGGQAYTLNFIGLKSMSSLVDTLYFDSSSTDTEDEVRRGLTHKMALGLVRFVARTSVAEQLLIRKEDASSGPVVTSNPEDDPWNSWVFGVNTGGSFRGEESSNNMNLNGGINANRVTEDWKIRLRLSGRLRESNFKVGDKTVTSRTENGSAWLLLVGSINEHWSLGGSLFTSTSSQRNQKISSFLSPTIEYNIFPYSESNRREIRIQYQLRLQSVKYDELTLFDKTSEQLLQQSLEMQLQFQQPWGSADMQIEGRNYLTDFEESKLEFYSIELGGSIQVRLIRGLTVNFGGSVQFIHDQLYLPKSDASDEDILLGTRNLATSYEFRGNFGFSYSFGSIYNNVVNPRFGF
jgi:hypothetical protein